MIRDLTSKQNCVDAFGSSLDTVDNVGRLPSGLATKKDQTITTLESVTDASNSTDDRHVTNEDNNNQSLTSDVKEDSDQVVTELSESLDIIGNTDKIKID